MSKGPVFTGSIDVTKILKEHINEVVRKDGTKAKFLNFAIFESKEPRFGNTHYIVQSVGKEARERGVKGPTLGDIKPGKSVASSKPATPDSDDGGTDDVPF